MYHFQPLGQNSIRLLQVQSALRNDLVVCIMNQYGDQYDDHFPPYDALSYYWGKPERTEKIYVNGALIAIHKSLWEFLDQMQRSHETKKWIWTDFICLDQNNPDEIGQQVPRMGQIYSNAERTISWLGCNDSPWATGLDSLYPASQASEADISLIAEKMPDKRSAVEGFFAQPKLLRWTDLTKAMFWRQPANDYLVWKSTRIEKSDVDKDLPKAIREVQQLSGGPIAQGMLNILTLPYWTRVWISQEVALAREVILVFGKASVHFDVFLLLYKAYSYYLLKGCGWKSVELKVPIEARLAVRENNASFHQIVRWGRNCRASKTVDRVYGLLGLLERFSDGTHTLPPILAQPIDYTKDEKEIYWEIVLTYHPVSDRSHIYDDRYSAVMDRWMEFFDDMGRSLSCPFTRESLQCADNDRATPLCRKKAHIALIVLDICRQAVMTDISIWTTVASTGLPDTTLWRPHTGSPASPPSSWPTSHCARQLWPQFPDIGKSLPDYQNMQLILGTLLIDTAAFQGVNEYDKYQAVVIGLKLFKSERKEGVWSCIPHQSMEKPLEHNIEFSIVCWTGISQFPCSSLSNTSSASSLQKSHQCQTADRYLEIERTGWRLSLKDLHRVGKGAQWRGILNIEY